MAALTDAQLTELRRLFAEDGVPINVVKATVNAALQAVEDWFSLVATQTAVSNAINTATSPAVLSNAQKRALVKFWLRQRMERGN